MSKILMKVVVGLIAAFLVILAIVAVVLPRLVAREDFQTTLREAATKALGAPIEWQDLDVGILPPRLMIQNPALSAGPGMPKDSRLAAKSLDLRLAIFPIFLSRIEIASLVVQGAEIVVTRTTEGFLLPPLLAVSKHPTVSKTVAGEADETANADRPDRIGEGGGLEVGAFSLAIDRIAVSNSLIIVHDQTVSPPVEWRIEGFELKVGARIATASLEIEMGAKIQAGGKEIGRVDVTGDVDLGGFGDIAIESKGLLVESLAPYLGEAATSGVLSGRVSIGGTVSEVQKIGLELRLENAVIRESGAKWGGRLRLKASRSDDQPIVCKATLDLGQGGEIDLDGTSTLAGRLDFRAKISSLDLALLGPLLPDSGMELGGKASGKARIVGPVQALEFLELDVHVEGGLLRVPDYRVAGPFDVSLRIDAPRSGSPRGRIDADLTAATLEYQDLFTKRAGMPAELKTKFSTNKDGQTEFQSRIKFRNIDEILFRGVLGETTSLAVTAPRFDLDGWSEVVPALEAYAPVGFVSFEEVGVESIEGSPNRFSGRINLEELDLTFPSLGRGQLRGSMLGAGAKFQLEEFQLTVGGTTLEIQGDLENPLRSRRFDLAFRSLGQSEANDFFGGFPAAENAIHGDLQIAGELSGTLGGEGDVYTSLNGGLRISVGKNGGGRLRGVSILQAVLDQFPILGGAALLTQPFRRGKSIDDYFTEDFEVIDGDFEIGGGAVNARTLRLVYEGYEAHLTGPVLLPSLEIDMTGEIFLKADLLSALGGLVGATIGDQKPVQIPLAHVTNTLSEPKVEMTAKTLVAVPQLIFKASGLETLTLGVGRSIGRSLRGGKE